MIISPDSKQVAEDMEKAILIIRYDSYTRN